jgi:hypothetical protein
MLYRQRLVPVRGEQLMNDEPIVRELRLPGSVLLDVRRAFDRETDPETSARAVQAAGYGTGASVFDGYAAMADADPTELEADRFWETLSRFLEGQGWGTLSQERIHPGLGLIRSGDWGESASASAGDGAGCEFSVGMLSRIFERTVGAGVAVLEVSCRGKGDSACAFAFGSNDAVGRLHTLLEGGETLDAALGQL